MKLKISMRVLCQVRLYLSSIAVVFATQALADPLVQCPAPATRIICDNGLPALEIMRPARAPDVTFRIGATAGQTALGAQMITLAPEADVLRVPLERLPQSGLPLAIVGLEGETGEDCCLRNVVVAPPDPELCAAPAVPDTLTEDALLPPQTPQTQADIQDPAPAPTLPDIGVALSFQDRCPEGAAGHNCTGTLSLSVTGQPQGPFPLTLTAQGGGEFDLQLSGPLTCYATGPTSRLCREDAQVLGAGLELPVTLSSGWSYVQRRITICAALNLPQGDRPLTYLVQTALNQIGIPAGTPDGQSGPRTRAAVAELANRFDLQTDDPTDPRLLALLGLTPYADAVVGNNRMCATTVLPARPRPTPVPDVAGLVTPAPDVDVPDTSAPDIAGAPAPICDPASTVSRAGGCACRYDRMTRLSQRRCVCTATRGPPAAAGCP